MMAEGNMSVMHRFAQLELDEHQCNAWSSVTKARTVDYKRSAVIVCDVWDRHWNTGAQERLTAMLPRMQKLINTLREKGTFILHAPSDTMAFYRDDPARLRMLSVPPLEPHVVRNIEEKPFPLDASDGGNDANMPLECVDMPVWSRQHPSIEINQETDGISDNGAEVYSYFKAHGIKSVFLVGVHTNMCVMNRSFAIKNMVRWGFETALVRDLTDPMYNPAMPPYVNREQAHELMVGYIEKFWCPSVLSTDLIT
jgi:nicotinamidase-related amidase